jgi:DNA invertase Pin-like site-specific DNA recombinase
MKVFQYIRISDKDQSNCSIDGQQRFNQMFAEKNGMEIIETFIDDGVSAKNFNRPEWKKLEAKLKKRQAQGVIVWKYDRLIRNVMEGLAFLDKAEKEYGVTIYSAMETFSINPFDPMFFKIRADILVNGEYERRIITDRTHFGIWSAKMQGKYIGPAPFGYINARDAKNKPIILVDEDKRHIVEYIFNAFSLGQSPTRIQHVANEMGMNRKGHDAIRTVITNPVYKGYILAPAYKGSDEKMVKGIHEQLIDESTWDKCQHMLNDKKPKSTVSEDLPLRGLAKCHGCGNVLTGGRSKGRSAFYHYYRCFTCKNVNLNSTKVENQMISILNQLSLPKEIIEGTKEKLLSEIIGLVESDKKERKDILSKIEDYKSKKESLELKYIENKIDHTTYTDWITKFNRQLSIYESDLKYLSNKPKLTTDYVDKNIKNLTKIGYIYSIASAIEKQELIRHIFGDNIYISNHLYRTAQNELLSSLITKEIKGLSIEDYNNLGTIYKLVPVSTPHRTQFEPSITSLMDLLAKIAS